MNGTTTSTYGSYQFYPTGETTLDIDATKYAEFNSTLNIDHAENVTVYKGYSYNNNVISVTDGDNILTMMSNSNMIAIKANSGCKIESITDNLGSSFSSDYNGCYNIYLSEGQVVTVTTSAIVRNDVVTINVDADPTDQNVINYFSFARADRSAITLNEGDNEVKFSSVDNPFGLSWYDSRGYTTAYLNGVKIKSYYEGGNSYELNFTNGDVLDVFIITEFTPFNVTFTNNNVISVTDGDNILTMMSNSNMIAIKANSGCKIESITDNLGSSFSSDYNGCYNIYLSEGQVVTVTTSAIVRNDVVTINVDADPTDQNVINYFSFARADRSAITLNEGDNEVKFSSVDNPFGLSWYDSRGYTTAYLNGVKIKSYYEGGNSYELNFTNGDVLDVFIITEFTPFNVTFTNNDESVAANTTVSVDGKGAAIDYWANGLTVLSGTTLSIAPAGDAPI